MSGLVSIERLLRISGDILGKHSPRVVGIFICHTNKRLSNQDMGPVPILVNEPLARKRWAGGEIEITCEKWSDSVDGFAVRSAGILRQIENEILNFHPARENNFLQPGRRSSFRGCSWVATDDGREVAHELAPQLGTPLITDHTRVRGT
eukprot:SAG11_NODE_3014_length_2762_cov_1.890349_1_plen_149_part_00